MFTKFILLAPVYAIQMQAHEEMIAREMEFRARRNARVPTPQDVDNVSDELIKFADKLLLQMNTEALSTMSLNRKRCPKRRRIKSKLP